MLKTGNPIRDFNRWDEYMWKMAQRLPICYECGERIYDESYYIIADHAYCEECVEAARKYND